MSCFSGTLTALDASRRALRVLLGDLSECIDLREGGEERTLRYLV